MSFNFYFLLSLQRAGMKIFKTAVNRNASAPYYHISPATENDLSADSDGLLATYRLCI